MSGALGKVVAIIGAGSGIGKAAATRRRLAEARLAGRRGLVTRSVRSPAAFAPKVFAGKWHAGKPNDIDPIPGFHVV